MTVPLSNFLRRIKPHVNGCPEITIADTLLDVLRDVCNDCDIWRNDKQAIVVVSGINEYELDAPTDTVIGKVLSVTTEAGEPVQGWHHNSRGTLQFLNALGTGQQRLYWVETTLIPAYTLTALPEQVFNEVVAFVPFGVAARLQDIPQNDWFNPNLAHKNQLKYRARLTELKIKTMGGFTQANQQATRRKFI